MPLDTAAKRSSAINVTSPWRARLPFPDATIDQGDRQAVAFMYSGIEAGAAQLVGTLVGTWSHVLTIQSPNRRIEIQSPNERL